MCLEDRPLADYLITACLCLISIGFGVELKTEASANVSVRDKEMNLTNNSGVKIYIN